METNRHATPEDFTRWEENAARMSVPALQWSRLDCIAAARNCDHWAPISAGRYIDESCAYGTELRRRGAQ